MSIVMIALVSARSLSTSNACVNPIPVLFEKVTAVPAWVTETLNVFSLSFIANTFSGKRLVFPIPGTEVVTIPNLPVLGVY